MLKTVPVVSPPYRWRFLADFKNTSQTDVGYRFPVGQRIVTCSFSMFSNFATDAALNLLLVAKEIKEIKAH